MTNLNVLLYMLTSYLRGIIPSKYRSILYALGLVTAFVFVVVQTFKGDWREALIWFGGTLVASLIHGNTDPLGNGKPDEPEDDFPEGE